MVWWACQTADYDERDAEALFLRPNLDQKIGNIWHFLFHADFPADLRPRIKALADRRNRFLHYKWPAMDMATSQFDDQKAQAKILVGGAPQLIEELQVLEDDLIFAGRRGDLKRAVERLRDRAPAE